MQRNLAAVFFCVVAVLCAGYAGAASLADVKKMTVDELKAKLDAGADVIIVDMRATRGYEKSNVKIKGALRIAHEELAGKMASLPKEKEVVIYCT